MRSSSLWQRLRWCLGRALSRYKPSTNRGLELPPFRGQVEILFVKMTDTCPGHPGSIFESLLCVLGWRYEEKTLHLCPARQELITLSTSVSEDHSRHLAQTHLIPGPYCCLHVWKWATGRPSGQKLRVWSQTKKFKSQLCIEENSLWFQLSELVFCLSPGVTGVLSPAVLYLRPASWEQGGKLGLSGSEGASSGQALQPVKVRMHRFTVFSSLGFSC